jgi:hypothetical protein
MKLSHRLLSSMLLSTLPAFAHAALQCTSGSACIAKKH